MNFTDRDIMVCASKKRYFSKLAAREKNMIPYKCEICYCWHRTSPKKIHRKHPLKDQYRMQKLKYYY